MSGELFPFLFGSLCFGFFVLVLMALGIYLVVFSLRSKKKAEDSQNWPGTPGTITLTEVKRSVNRDDDGNESYAYYPKVEYTYQVGGETLTGKRPASVQNDLERYPVGGQVTSFMILTSLQKLSSSVRRVD
jgi:hypothetical protein